MLYDYRERIKQSKIYFKKYLPGISIFSKMNREYHKKYLLTEQLFESVDSILNEIAVRMLEEPVADIGLSKGRMGMVIFCFITVGSARANYTDKKRNNCWRISCRQ